MVAANSLGVTSPLAGEVAVEWCGGGVLFLGDYF